MEPASQYPALALHLGLAAAIPAAIAVIAGRLAPCHPSAAKLRPYECGVSEPLAAATRLPVRFALVGMLFLLFDVEALFLYPWAVQARELGWPGLAAAGSFLLVLGTGYFYARARKALDWR
jgi:NADH-quinone oxidoreductase subunit A